MRIAILQTGESLAALTPAAEEAAAAGGVRLLICPEMFLTGYNVPGVGDLAEPADGPAAHEVARIARDAGIAVLYGYPERDGDATYNSVQLIDRNGSSLANYRKTHLYGDVDMRTFTPSDGGFEVVDLDGVRLGLLICYDVEFPETVRALALAGADLVAVPTALMRPYEVVTRTLVPARAYENQVYVAYANRCGTEGEFTYCGESCVVAPDGTELARAGDHEDLLFADIDQARHRAARDDNTHLRDRRPELYGALTARQETAG
jgi:predicted amidohydrolase